MQKNQRYLDPSELLQEPEAGGNFLQRVPAAKPPAAAKGDKGAKKRKKRGKSSSSSGRCCRLSPTMTWILAQCCHIAREYLLHMSAE